MTSKDGPTDPLQLSRRQLFDRIWSKPMTTNAAELGTAAPTLAALARRLGLPTPRAGHWMKMEVGKAPPTPDYPADPALDDTSYRPWRAPTIPEHDYVPNGELVLKFDHDYDAGGTRRTFSDGKRQRLEDLVPSMIESLERWGMAVKARRAERAEQARKWAEQDRRRKDIERQVRVEGYRITFLQRQVERKREVDGLSGLIGLWEQAEDPDPKFAELLEFARLYQKWLEAKLAPGAVAERIADLKLMDDDVYIYDAKRLD